MLSPHPICLPLFVVTLVGFKVIRSELISPQPSVQVKTTQHDTVILPCLLNQSVDSESVVKWWKGDLLIAESSKSIESPANVRLYRNHSLEVADVSSSDSGDYRCQMVWSHPPISIIQTHSILVLYPPSLKIVPESGLVEVEVNKEITIGCNPSGVPKPSLKWMFKGKEIQQLNMRNTLRFTATDKSMEGEYVCTASNGVGDPASASVVLRLLYAPEVYMSKKWIHTAPRLRTEVTCTTKANPSAKIVWLKNGKQITSGNGITIRLVVLDLGEMQILVIRNTRMSDFGEYICRATNVYGSSEASTHISGIPNAAIFKKGFTTLSDSNFTLVWEVESYSPIIQHKLLFRKYQAHRKAINWTQLIIPADAYSPGPFHTQVYTLSGLARATLYETVVTTRNIFGWSQPSQPFKFATPGIELPENDIPLSTEPYMITEQIVDEQIFESNVQQLNSNGSRILSSNIFCLLLVSLLKSILQF